MTRLCLHLDPRGRPCNRRTMRPLSLCDQHRERVRPSVKGSHTSAEGQRAWKQRRAQAGVLAGWEGA